MIKTGGGLFVVFNQYNAAEMCAAVASWFRGLCTGRGPCHGLCIGEGVIVIAPKVVSVRVDPA